MNTRTAGVIVLISFLTALVVIVWILMVASARQREGTRIDSDSRRAIPTSPVYTKERIEAETSREEVDA